MELLWNKKSISPVHICSHACICWTAGYERASFALSFSHSHCSYISTYTSICKCESPNKQVYLHLTATSGKNTKTPQCPSWEVWESGEGSASVHRVSGTLCIQVHIHRCSVCPERPAVVFGEWGLNSKLILQHAQQRCRCAHECKWASASFMYPLGSILRGPWLSCSLLAHYSLSGAVVYCVMTCTDNDGPRIWRWSIKIMSLSDAVATSVYVNILYDVHTMAKLPSKTIFIIYPWGWHVTANNYWQAGKRGSVQVLCHLPSADKAHPTLNPCPGALHIESTNTRYQGLERKSKREGSSSWIPRGCGWSERKSSLFAAAWTDEDRLNRDEDKLATW